MKSILISIKPRWVAKILNGTKTIEIRKSMPKCELPIDVYIYCTKGSYIGYLSNKYVGKVVAKFTLNKVEEIYWKQDLSNPYISDNYNLETDTLNEWELRNKSYLESEELEDYLGFDESEFKALGYAWHIDNLVIFDKPKELSEFKTYFNDFYKRKPHPLMKAPQSWQFVEYGQS